MNQEKREKIVVVVVVVAVVAVLAGGKLLEQLFTILNNPDYLVHRSILFKNLNMVDQVEHNRANQWAISNNIV